MAFFCSSDVDRLRLLLEREDEDADWGSARMVIFATLETRWKNVKLRKDGVHFLNVPRSDLRVESSIWLSQRKTMS